MHIDIKIKFMYNKNNFYIQNFKILGNHLKKSKKEMENQKRKWKILTYDSQYAIIKGESYVQNNILQR